MLNLILAMMAIALSAMFLETTASYINPSAIYSSEYASSLQRGLVDLKKGYDAYVSGNGGTPQALSDITPQYAFLPPKPRAMSWSFANGSSANGTSLGQYFCLSGNANQSQVNALVSAENYFSAQAYFINTTCGAITQAVPNIPSSSNKTQVALTYWVKGY